MTTMMVGVRWPFLDTKGDWSTILLNGERGEGAGRMALKGQEFRVELTIMPSINHCSILSLPPAAHRLIPHWHWISKSPVCIQHPHAHIRRTLLLSLSCDHPITHHPYQLAPVRVIGGGDGLQGATDRGRTFRVASDEADCE